MHDERGNTCEDCDECIDEGENLCDECSERRWEAWLEHQDWLRMTDREREDAIRLGYR